jgi:hypothetical protein
MPVGKWRVELVLPGNRQQRQHQDGVWTGTNLSSAYRTCLGPQLAQTDGANTAVRMTSSHAIGTAIGYGLESLTKAVIMEDMRWVVTGSGLLTLQWAQESPSIQDTFVQAGSRIYASRIA